VVLTTQSLHYSFPMSCSWRISPVPTYKYQPVGANTTHWKTQAEGLEQRKQKQSAVTKFPTRATKLPSIGAGRCQEGVAMVGVTGPEGPDLGNQKGTTKTNPPQHTKPTPGVSPFLAVCPNNVAETFFDCLRCVGGLIASVCQRFFKGA